MGGGGLESVAGGTVSSDATEQPRESSAELKTDAGSVRRPLYSVVDSSHQMARIA